MLYLNLSDDLQLVLITNQSSRQMLLLGSQEKGWPLGCLSRASLGQLVLAFFFSVCLFLNTLLAEKTEKRKANFILMYKSFLFLVFIVFLSPYFGC